MAAGREAASRCTKRVRRPSHSAEKAGYTGDAAENFVAAAVCYAVASLLILTDFRARGQAFLASRGEGAAAAAGISELLGGQSVEAVLQKARGTFRYVPADCVYREDMATNKPNPELAKYTKLGRLGAVDAFVSHSWHDGEEEKWNALQAWREEFKATNKREPRLWIDKYCIDQNKIDDSLACLPVYLSGCRYLLALVGTTYLERLWCVMEIYIYLEMGGDASSFIVSPLLGECEEAGEGSSDLQKLISEFSVSDARCFLKEDTNRLHEVIEAGTSGKHGVEDMVRRTFLEALSKPVIARAATARKLLGTSSTSSLPVTGL